MAGHRFLDFSSSPVRVRPRPPSQFSSETEWLTTSDSREREREGYFLIEISEQVARLMYLRQASGILQRGGIYMWHPQNCLALWTQNPLPYRATNLDYENYATARLPLGGDVIHGIRISEQTTYTEPKKSLYMWLGECCRQVEAEEVSKSRNKIHETWQRSLEIPCTIVYAAQKWVIPSCS